MACAVPASIHFRLTAYSAISRMMDSSAETTPMMAEAVIYGVVRPRCQIAHHATEPMERSPPISVVLISSVR